MRRMLANDNRRPTETAYYRKTTTRANNPRIASTMCLFGFQPLGTVGAFIEMPMRSDLTAPMVLSSGLLGKHLSLGASTTSSKHGPPVILLFWAMRGNCTHHAHRVQGLLFCTRL